MRSKLIPSMPARLSMSTTEAVCSKLCTRLIARCTTGSKLCTPRLARLTPESRIASTISRSAFADRSRSRSRPTAARRTPDASPPSTRQSLRRHDRRRAAAEMDVLDLDAATDGFRDKLDLAQERPLIGRDELVAADDLGMAAAIPAHLAAERDVQIERGAGAGRELGQPPCVGIRADRRREVGRGRIARIAWQTFLAVARREIKPHVLPIRKFRPHTIAASPGMDSTNS